MIKLRRARSVSNIINEENFGYKELRQSVESHVDRLVALNNFGYNYDRQTLPLGTLISRMIKVAENVAVTKMNCTFECSEVTYNKKVDTFYFRDGSRGIEVAFAMCTERPPYLDGLTIYANSLINNSVMGYEAFMCKKVSVGASKLRQNDILLT